MNSHDTDSTRGMRAEPKLLRDPTSLESISSGLSWLSLYVTSNLQKKRPLQHPQLRPHEHQQRPDEHRQPESNAAEHESLLFASFQQMGNKPPSTFLMLGYANGFQLWDVTNLDNVHEACSVRDPQQLGAVKFMHILPDPKIDDQFPNERPLLALVCNTKPDNHHNDDDDQQHAILRLYSLRTHQIIRDFQFLADDGLSVKSVQSNDRYIVLGCIGKKGREHTAALHVISNSTLEQACVPLVDVSYHQQLSGPVYALGPRYLAYATMAELSFKEDRAGNFLAQMSDKYVKGAARDIAKEVVSGVRSLGEYGYQSLSSYFNQETAMSYDVAQQHRRAATTGCSTVPLDTASVKQPAPPTGMVMIRDLSAAQQNIVAHIRPHTHPVTSLAFNQSGTLLLSASSQGHTFYIFSLMDGAQLVYRLSRGITDAQVTDAQFATDSLWCAVSTAKGTTHIYAINPYGGRPEIRGHVQSRVVNPRHRFLDALGDRRRSTAVSISPMMRIKQRHPIQSKSSADGSSNTTESHYSFNTPSPVSPPPFLSVLSSTPPLHEDAARLATLFLPVTKIPYHHQQEVSGSGSGNGTVGLPWLRNQATSQLGHMYNVGAAVVGRRWSDDARIFGFDEEQESESGDDGRPVSVAHRDLFSIHPDGILTLHRCWMTETLVRTRDHGRIVERMELNAKESDVAEWHVARHADWAEVKRPYSSIKACPSMSALPRRHGWLSYAEIATYDASDVDQVIWMAPGFSMHVFTGGNVGQLLEDQGTVPPTQALAFKHAMPEPYSIRIGRVGRTRIAGAGEAGSIDDERLDDALAELEDNISSAMKTSFSPSTQYLGVSPILRHSSSALGSESVEERASPFSFEDAQLISLGAEEPYTHQQQSRSSNTTDLEEQESSEITFFSPDGDNEIASPHDSVFGTAHFPSSG